MFPEAKILRAEELRVGLTAEFERDVTEADVLAFAANSGDANPLHVDGDYARGTSYGARIVHGAFQVGFASALIGMYLPGKHVLLANLGARFLAPLYFPCRVRVRGEIVAWQTETRAGQLKVVVVETARKLPVTEVVLGFTLHEPARTATAVATETAPTTTNDRRQVLITGASGGVGAHLVAALASDYDVIAVTRQTPLEESLTSLPGVREWRADLSSAEMNRDALSTLLAGRPLYAIVHAAWPGAPLGGLLQAPDEVVESQILFGATTTIRLARLLFETVGPDGGRFVALSSIVGSHKPIIGMAAYSLGKAAQENAVRLLAPELGRRNVTINAVCPSFIPAGINRHKSEQQRKIEASRVPLGRVCEVDDVAGVVAYLLSPGASFVSGQLIGLAGGQL